MTRQNRRNVRNMRRVLRQHRAQGRKAGCGIRAFLVPLAVGVLVTAAPASWRRAALRATGTGGDTRRTRTGDSERS